MKSSSMTEILEEYIRGMSLSVGDRLPSEQEISETLGITRHQLRKSIADLKQVGKLHQRRGAGTYIGQGILRKSPKEKLIVLVCPMDPQFSEIVDQFQREAFHQGYQLVVVNSSQDPDFERDYLRELRRRNPTGLIINPSPYYQEVFSDIKQLREVGVKVALLSAPPKRVEDNAVFAYDYFNAGYESCRRLLDDGFRKQIILSALHVMPLAWHYQSHLAGARRAAADLQVDLRVTHAHARLERINYALRWQETDALPLESGVGYICGNNRQATLLNRDLCENNAKDFAICGIGTVKLPLPFSYFLFDEGARLRAVLDYLLDPKVLPNANIQHSLTSVFIGSPPHETSHKEKEHGKTVHPVHSS